MSMSQPTILISIINWNSTARTLQCVEQLQAQDYPHHKIVVVDNASQAQAKEALKEALPPSVQLIESSDNRGYAGGHALTLDLAQQEDFDCFWFLNTDTILPPDTLRKLVETYQVHGEQAIYGGIPLEQSTGKSLHEHRVLLHRKFFNIDYREMLFTLNALLRFGELFDDMTPRIVTSLSGSCVLVPMPVIRKYGFMDESFFLYSEEVDYCFRLKSAGVPCIAVPQAHFNHESGGISRGYRRMQSIILYYRLRNQLIRIRRHNSRNALVRSVIKDMILMISYLRHGRAGLEMASFTWRAIQDGLRGKSGKTYPPEDYRD